MHDLTRECLQWQKISLSQSLINPRTELIVLDEPSSALDPVAEAAVFDTIFSMRGKARPLLLDSRHRKAIDAVCDRQRSSSARIV
jgi:ABC-type uncharacterized transport system ATPase subunit